MIPKGLFTQIAMFIISVAIILTYIRPQLGEIKQIQDDIFVYQEETGKVDLVNEELDDLLDDMDSVSNDDRRRLRTYLPNDVDGISVSRDLYLIALKSGVLFESVGNEESFLQDDSRTRNRNNNKPSSDSNLPTPHELSLSVLGTYDQVKDMFAIMEQNNYPFEIQSINITASEEDILQVNVRIMTYEYKPAPSAGEII